MKQRVMYKTVTYFTKTNRPHEVSIGYARKNKLGCSFNSTQGVRRFTAIATQHEIETHRKEMANNKPPIRMFNGQRLPNRHQRKHGMA